MASPRIKRVLKFAALTPPALLLLAFAYVQIAQHILRHRAERLLADFHSIRLQQSTWQDFNSIRQRWGKFGHANGSCTPADCTYSVQLEDTENRILGGASEKWGTILSHSRIFDAYEHLGARPTRLDAYFGIHDGIVSQSALVFIVEHPSVKSASQDEYGLPVEDKIDPFAMGYIVQSKNFLRRGSGLSAAFDDHPDYNAWRPSGCTICELVHIDYTPFATPADLATVTDFQLDCITRFHPCALLSDLLPAEKPWNMYVDELPPAGTQHAAPLHPCLATPRTLGREAASILAVEALDTTQVTLPKLPPYSPTATREQDTVRVLQVLKGPAVTQGLRLRALPYLWAENYTNTDHVSEHMAPGQHYLLLLYNNSPVDDQPQQLQLKEDPVLELDWCGITDDTPEARSQISVGIAQREAVMPRKFQLRWW